MAPMLRFLSLAGARPAPMEPPPASALCLGNFDGVHRAHAALLAEGRRLAADRGVPAGVFCFPRPSTDYFDLAARHITTLREKLARFCEAGMDFVCLCDFAAVRNLTPAAFADLLAGAGCIGVACGYNYRFGLRAAGGPADLIARFGANSVRVLPALLDGGEPISSTRIRAALACGDVASATRLLGRPPSLTARVRQGKQLGRELGFPTANQHFPAELLVPAHGVYAVLCHTPEGVYPGVANIGLRPTVDHPAGNAPIAVNCETHILGFSGDLYGTFLTVDFLAYLRPETAFPDLAALRSAIEADARRAAEVCEGVLGGMTPPSF